MMVASLACFEAQATTAYVFTYLPSLPGRDARDINNNGQVIGNYCPTISRCDSYVYSGGVLTTFSPPNADSYGSTVNKINNSGAVVGGYTPIGSTTFPGFVGSGSTFTDVNIGAYGTSVLGFSNSGAISGVFFDSPNPTGPTTYHGFIQSTLGGPVTDLGANAAVWGINSFGQAVYNVAPNTIATPQTAYLYSNGVSARIDIPNAFSTAVVDINDAGQIVGSFNTVRGGALSGFVATNGSYGVVTPQRGGSINLYGINDLGQIVGYESYGYINQILHADPFTATLANLPNAIVNGAYTFNLQVIGGVPVFIDPLVAVGYDYAIGAGDPDFQTVRLPVGIGDDLYTITLPDGTTFTVSGGELFDFTAHGYVAGLDHFSVGGIETSAGLDPADGNAFVTGLTFVGDGFFTGTMTPRTVLLAVDEPATIGLLALGLVGFGFAGGRRRSSRTTAA